jgi:hypothetical protein
VQRTRNTDALPLPAREVNALLPDLGQITVGQRLHLRKQRGGSNAAPVPRLVPFLAEEDVVPYRRVLDPRSLLAVRHASAKRDCTGSAPHLAEKAAEDTALATADRAYDRYEAAPRDVHVEVADAEGTCFLGAVSVSLGVGWPWSHDFLPLEGSVGHDQSGVKIRVRGYSRINELGAEHAVDAFDGIVRVCNSVSSCGMKLRGFCNSSKRVMAWKMTAGLMGFRGQSTWAAQRQRQSWASSWRWPR